MKAVSFTTLVVLFSTLISHAQSGYQVVVDSADGYSRILKGEITNDELTFYDWYLPNQKSYTTIDKVAIDGLKLNSQNVNLVVFGGTWDASSQTVIPQFFKLISESGFPGGRIVMYGVDRNMKTEGSLARDYNISRVPTIIVMKDGKEIGRVVEFGESGKWDKDFGKLFLE